MHEKTLSPCLTLVATVSMIGFLTTLTFFTISNPEYLNNSMTFHRQVITVS
ncbi:hypothetical protein Psal027_03346 (plasmid) [Piscirickettsia salmonis]|uniref:hypothetical protein n=1 Tax=Piscirickettsia salmonis TaxID=1238 RepID=UPI000332D6D3|nr:hypothetical protein [Piscirickettsia salmonis]ERL60762.1 hypothetical protein K661_02919 [Piscirickettsia salmonis LF-89 = ATCC VR-1361]QGN79044.1 hypothetical protein Psal001_03305 [Piscirickettsia salmonis]QGN82628.1 hypothetical protein Psal002_03324 [Piscirickettsia salmonis]QGN86204.1 hypothetical protein Psal003_03310 [Piscirickettsia salmonis]QGN89710.1 hypothetical protein Psal004_03302 [Piscirickettsia salmonis]